MTRISDSLRTILPALVAGSLAGSLAVAPLIAATPADAAAAHGHAKKHHHAGTPLTGVMRADPANPHNPLAGVRWGTYLGLGDHTYQPWIRSHGSTRKALGVIAKTPKPRWFGNTIPNRKVAGRVHDYIRQGTGGHPNVMVQMALSRMDPWENEACTRLPSRAEQRSYKQYVDSFVHAVGTARVAMVVQPDGLFARCAPHHSTLRSKQIAYTVRKLHTLPRVSSYIEMGSSDWVRGEIHDPVKLLLREDVAHARGFALDTSHFASINDEIAFGTRIVQALAKHGMTDKHFVIDTSDNGRGFTGEQYHHRYGKNAVLGHAPACRTKQQRVCAALGVRPTTDVAEARWGLSPRLQRLAAEHVDAYLWIGHPWMHHESYPYDVRRALALVHNTPFPQG